MEEGRQGRSGARSDEPEAGSDTLWATDATEGWSKEGRSAIFAVIDHASGEVFCDASLRMDRWAAADLLREATTERFGSVERAVAAGLALRYDGGACFRSAHYQAEIDHLGIARSPAYTTSPRPTAASNGHGHPQGTGALDRALRYPRGAARPRPRFRPRLQPVVLLERHGYRTPIEARQHLLRQELLT